MIEAESQALLNAHKKHNFKVVFRKCRSAGNGVYLRKGTTSRAMVASKPKISF
jgi:hypothetical protein